MQASINTPSKKKQSLEQDMTIANQIINNRRQRIPFWQRYEQFLQKKDRFASLYTTAHAGK